MAVCSLKTLSILAVLVALSAILYRKRSNDMVKEKLDDVLKGLLRAEKKVGVDRRVKIALGFGGCEDIFVNAMDVLDKLNYTSPNKPEHFENIVSDSDFSKMFAYFFQYGAAAERYIENATLFAEIAKASGEIASARRAIGGNAPAMASRLAMEGAEVLLAARFTKETLKNLPASIEVVGEPAVENDLHIILEYAAGATWGNLTANRANSDRNNPHLDTLEDLEMALPNFDPQVFVVGGLQMMDNFPFKEGICQRRLNKLRDVLSNVDRSTKIHFELASFSDPTLMKEIIETVVLYSDSLGMNEQELPNLVGMLTNGQVSLLSDSAPRIATVLDQMRKVFNLLKNTEETNGRRKLTRLHVHTLAYQAILTTKDSEWKNTMSAAAKASLTANRHVCGSNWIDLEKAKMIMDESFSTSTLKENADRISMNENRPVSCWEEEEFNVCLAPVLVCTEVLQTGGGGDNISSAGLLFQI